MSDFPPVSETNNDNEAGGEVSTGEAPATAETEPASRPSRPRSQSEYSPRSRPRATSLKPTLSSVMLAMMNESKRGKSPSRQRAMSESVANRGRRRTPKSRSRSSSQQLFANLGVSWAPSSTNEGRNVDGDTKPPSSPARSKWDILSKLLESPEPERQPQKTRWPSLSAVMKSGRSRSRSDSGCSDGENLLDALESSDGEAAGRRNPLAPTSPSTDSTGSRTPPSSLNRAADQRRVSTPSRGAVATPTNRNSNKGGLEVERSISQPSLQASLTVRGISVAKRVSSSARKASRRQSAPDAQTLQSIIDEAEHRSIPGHVRRFTSEPDSPWSQQLRRQGKKSTPRKSFRKSMREVGDFLRMGHGRNHNEDWHDDDDDEAVDDVWRSKMGWGPKLPDDVDAIEYESHLLDLERANSTTSMNSGASAEHEDPHTIPLEEQRDGRQRILIALGHVGVQAVEFLICLFLLFGTGTYLLLGNPGVGSDVYEGFCFVVLFILIILLVLMSYAKPKYTFGTSSLLDLITVAAVIWEIVWLSSGATMYEKSMQSSDTLEDSCQSMFGGLSAANAASTGSVPEVAWSWFGRTCSGFWAGDSDVHSGIDTSWNAEQILEFSTNPLRYLTAFQLLKLAYLNTFNHWFGSCAQRRAQPVAMRKAFSFRTPRSSGRRYGFCGSLSSLSKHLSANLLRYGVFCCSDHVGVIEPGLSPVGKVPRTSDAGRFIQRADSRASDGSIGGDSVATLTQGGPHFSGRAKLYRRSETIGNKLTQVFMSKAALGYMCIIVMTSYLYRPACVPDASIIAEVSNLKNVADGVVTNASYACESIESCCNGSDLCAGAAYQIISHRSSELVLLMFPGGTAYSSARDGDDLGFADSPDAQCSLSSVQCGSVAEDMCTGLQTGATTLFNIACADLHVYEYWTVVLPSVSAPGGFYVAVIDRRDVVNRDHAYNMYLDIFVAAIFIFGTLLMNCSMQSFAYKLSSPLKRLAVEMQKVSNLDFSSRNKRRQTGMVPSKFYEIFDIQLQFLRMQAALKSFAKFMPESVVQLHFQTLKAPEARLTQPHLSLSSTSAQVSAICGVVPMLPCSISDVCVTSSCLIWSQVELKVVTLLFSDIKSFTTLCESIPAEKMCLLLNEYFEAMCAIVEHHGGTVIEFIGDAMLVVWNIPFPVHNHAEHCARFAIEAQHELSELRTIWIERGLPSVEVRMGIHTGLVYAGILGSSARFKYGLLGESLNVASYLEEANKRYHTDVIVSAGTVAHIKMFQEHQRAVEAALSPAEPAIGGKFEEPDNTASLELSEAFISNKGREDEDDADTSKQSHLMLNWLKSDFDVTPTGEEVREDSAQRDMSSNDSFHSTGSGGARRSDGSLVSDGMPLHTPTQRKSSNFGAAASPKSAASTPQGNRIARKRGSFTLGTTGHKDTTVRHQGTSQALPRSVPICLGPDRLACVHANHITFRCCANYLRHYRKQPGPDALPATSM